MDIVPAMEIPTDRVSYCFGETRSQLILRRDVRQSRYVLLGF